MPMLRLNSHRQHKPPLHITKIAHHNSLPLRHGTPTHKPRKIGRLKSRLPLQLGWWDSLTQQNQHNYLEQHPHTTKHIKLHDKPEFDDHAAQFSPGNAPDMDEVAQHAVSLLPKISIKRLASALRNKLKDLHFSVLEKLSRFQLRSPLPPLQIRPILKRAIFIGLATATGATMLTMAHPTVLLIMLYHHLHARCGDPLVYFWERIRHTPTMISNSNMAQGLKKLFTHSGVDDHQLTQEVKSLKHLT